MLRQSRLTWARAASLIGLALLSATAAVAAPAFAGLLEISCAKEDVIVPSWNSPLSVSYDGEAQGTLTVASKTLALSLPASREVRTVEIDGKPHAVTGIVGAADTTSIMPDRAALEACAAKGVDPDFKDDPDMVAIAVTSCLASTPLGAAPVPVRASVAVSLVPKDGGGDPDVVVEIKRSFAGTKTSIDTFPKDCALVQP